MEEILHHLGCIKPCKKMGETWINYQPQLVSRISSTVWPISENKSKLDLPIVGVDPCSVCYLKSHLLICLPRDAQALLLIPCLVRGNFFHVTSSIDIGLRLQQFLDLTNKPLQHTSPSEWRFHLIITSRSLKKLVNSWKVVSWRALPPSIAKLTL